MGPSLWLWNLRKFVSSTEDPQKWSCPGCRLCPATASLPADSASGTDSLKFKALYYSEKSFYWLQNLASDIFFIPKTENCSHGLRIGLIFAMPMIAREENFVNVLRDKCPGFWVLCPSLNEFILAWVKVTNEGCTKRNVLQHFSPFISYFMLSVT